MGSLKSLRLERALFVGFGDPTGLPNRWVGARRARSGKALAPEDFKSCSRQILSVPMGHISRECGRFSGDDAHNVTRENR